MEDELLTLKEVCDILKMKPQAVRKLYKEKGLPVVRFEKNNVKFLRSVINNWIVQHTVVYESKKVEEHE
jgi:predicted DNA-binding transcriptional regulator AlpA